MTDPTGILRQWLINTEGHWDKWTHVVDRVFNEAIKSRRLPTDRAIKDYVAKRVADRMRDHYSSWARINNDQGLWRELTEYSVNQIRFAEIAYELVEEHIVAYRETSDE